mmetsp:Transcript_60419/g.112193  ORF Transcript_60419/g.112193 Transcript_60419/m.112193 type:complete len:231 (-) Transcript_60419:133-825(-)
MQHVQVDMRWLPDGPHNLRSNISGPQLLHVRIDGCSLRLVPMEPNLRKLCAFSNCTRSHDRTSDVLIVGLVSQSLHECMQGVLGSTVDRASLIGLHTGDTASRDNMASSTFEHTWQHFTHQAECPITICIQHFLDIRQEEAVNSLFTSCQAGIVHKEVCVIKNALLSEGRNCLVCANVARDDFHLHTETPLLYLSLYLIQPVLASRQESDIALCSCQHTRGGLSNACRSA